VKCWGELEGIDNRIHDLGDHYEIPTRPKWWGRWFWNEITNRLHIAVNDLAPYVDLERDGVDGDLWSSAAVLEVIVGVASKEWCEPGDLQDLINALRWVISSGVAPLGHIDPADLAAWKDELAGMKAFARKEGRGRWWRDTPEVSGGEASE
jgi:hypothetical protein